MVTKKSPTKSPRPSRIRHNAINAAIGAMQRADEHGDDGEITEALAQLSKAKTAIAAAEGALRDEKRAGA